MLIHRLNLPEDPTRHDERRKAIGYDQAGLDESAKQGFANGAFEESGEEIPEIVEEFFPDASADPGHGGGDAPAVVQTRTTVKPTLREKLDKQAASSKPGEVP